LLSIGVALGVIDIADPSMSPILRVSVFGRAALITGSWSAGAGVFRGARHTGRRMINVADTSVVVVIVPLGEWRVVGVREILRLVVLARRVRMLVHVWYVASPVLGMSVGHDFMAGKNHCACTAGKLVGTASWRGIRRTVRDKNALNVFQHSAVFYLLRRLVSPGAAGFGRILAS
jgi:hypothetical protein